jgi:hypothetical protein
MNTPRLFALALSLVLALVAFAPAYAQEGDAPAAATSPTNDNAPVDTSGSSTIAEYDMDFDNVFKVVKAALIELGYPDNYSSKKKKMIETGFRQLVDGSEFFTVMSDFGEVPYIRSPGWTVGRAKMMVNFEVLENGRVTVKVLGQLSGYEERFTNIWHYWKSNGKLEQEAMDAINAAVDKEKASAGAGSGSGTSSN